MVRGEEFTKEAFWGKPAYMMGKRGRISRGYSGQGRSLLNDDTEAHEDGHVHTPGRSYGQVSGRQTTALGEEENSSGPDAQGCSLVQPSVHLHWRGCDRGCTSFVVWLSLGIFSCFLRNLAHAAVSSGRKHLWQLYFPS